MTSYPQVLGLTSTNWFLRALSWHDSHTESLIEHLRIHRRILFRFSCHRSHT